MSKIVKLNRGDFYEDCGYHPRLCTHSGEDIIEGISLIDGSIGNCSPRYCGVRVLTKEAAMRIAVYGPYSKRTRKYLKEFYAHPEWGNGRKIWWKDRD